jgi:hypothetical protein
MKGSAIAANGNTIPILIATLFVCSSAHPFLKGRGDKHIARQTLLAAF